MPTIELSGVTHQYAGQEHPALSNFSIRIEQGEFVAIVGPSGSGKSTLLNILGLLEKASSGDYLIDGVLTEELTERERDTIRSNNFGFVFQSSHVLGDDTVYSNAELGLRIQAIDTEQRRAKVLTALASVGLDCPETQRARLLSGGERQRLAIARAIATNPDAIFADEPTGNLDSRNGARVIELLHGFQDQGKTVVLVTHDTGIADQADRQLSIHDGELAQDTRRVPYTPPPASIEEPLIRRRPSIYAESLRSIFIKPLRFVTLLLAFLVGIAGLVTAQGLSESAAAQVNQRLTATALDGVTAKLPTTHDLWADMDGTLASWQAQATRLPRVEQAAWIAGVPPSGTVISRNSATGPEPREPLSLAAASPQFFSLKDAVVRPSGAAVLLENPEAGPVVILGQGAAQALGIPDSSLQLNRSIWIDGRRMAVVGIARFPDEDGVSSAHDNTVFVPRTFLRNSKQQDINAEMHVRTEPGYPAAVAQALPFQLAPENPGSIGVTTVADLIGLRVGVSSDLAVFVFGLSIIVLLLACLAGGIAMYLSVVARTSEIALRRAIGTSRPGVFALFLSESLIIGIVGGALGAVVGQAATLGIVAAVGWAPVLSGWAGPIGLVAGAVCGLFAGTFPAISASRKSPAEAIRQ